MYNVVVIGAGQLGSRHLQGLKTSKLDLSIYIVDPSSESLEIAKERYDQIEGNIGIKSVSLLKKIDFLPEDLNLVIIATNSSVRAEITSSLLKSKNVKNVIFEKFLFPSLSDYPLVSELLKKYNIKAWVNCPRRMFTYFKDLRQLLKDSNNIQYLVNGGDWGLACNSIHFIDCFAFLANIEDYEIDYLKLDEEVLDSKRAGFVEFTGTIKGSVNHNLTFSLTSISGSLEAPVININTDKYAIEIGESSGEMRVTSKDGVEEIKKIQLLFQSQLTGILAEQILLTGNSDLTTFEESANLHLRFLKPMVDFYNLKTGKTQDSCPIT